MYVYMMRRRNSHSRKDYNVSMARVVLLKYSTRARAYVTARLQSEEVIK